MNKHISIYSIKSIGDMEVNEVNPELEKLAKPLIEYLKENHHPHTAILITDDRVMVVETVLSVPDKFID